MKSGKRDRTIEKIFREQFQDYKIEPSKGFWPKFQKRLSGREFLRFNPGKFNIFYLGVAAVGVIVATLLINDKGVKTEDSFVKESVNLSAPAPDTGQTPETINIPVDRSSKGSVQASQKVTTVENRIFSDESVKEENIRLAEESAVKSDKLISSGLDKVVIAGGNVQIETDHLVKPSPDARFEADNIFGCKPLKVSFKNLSVNYDSCMWEFGDGGYSTDKEPVWIFDEDGDYDVRLIVFGADGQTTRFERMITVYPLPVAKFEISSGDPLFPDERVMFYNYSENSVEWRWEFGDGAISQDFEPFHHYNNGDSYSVKLIAVSPNGCLDSLVITNAFGANSCYLKFPNVFIPNSGGPTGGYYSSRTDIQSEVFHPAWSGVTEYNLRIFSRSGLLVFETNDINVGWDGYYKGQKADSGVYIWKVRGQFKNGDPFVQGGDVTLLPKRQ